MFVQGASCQISVCFHSRCLLRLVHACPGVDDRWYSLSPHFVDSKLPEWKQWRLRNRSAPLDQPLSESFKERLEALRR